MMFEDLLKAHLQADTAIAALVADRIYPETIPQGSVIPAITYTVISGEPRNSLDGFTSKLVNYRVQLDCWCAGYRDAAALALLLRDRINTASTNLTGLCTSAPAAADFESETKRHRRNLDASFWHTET
jgi:hypothetical protein